MSDTIHKTASLDELAELISSLPADGNLIYEAPITGGSMFPFFRPGDRARLRTGTRDIRVGSVIAFHTQDGRFLIHRVIRIKREQGVMVSVIPRGDARAVCDPPVLCSQIIGILTARIRDGHVLHVESARGRLCGWLSVCYYSTILWLHHLARRVVDGLRH